MNVDKTFKLGGEKTALNLNSLSSNGISSGNKNKAATANTSNAHSNFYEVHPPEVFVLQDERTDQLNTFLLNFVPANANKEFGQNDVWSGKLYEWNLTGDTILVQDIEKSKLIKRFAIKVGHPAGSVNNKSAVMSLNDKKQSSIFGDFFILALFGNPIC